MVELQSQTSDGYPSYAYGKPHVQGVLRSCPDDFFVEEYLGFEPCGEGEHVFLWVEKRGQTSFYVRDQIAKLANCHARDVGYSGLKDRHAHTRQWYSVYDPKRQSIDWSDLEIGGESDSAQQSISVLKVTRHNKKLKRGVHKTNFFRLVVKRLSGDLDELSARLKFIEQQGFPNYFGEQRFGRNANNIQMIERYFSTTKKKRKRLPKDKKSLGLSSARSLIFNEFLSARIQDDNWNSYLAGDYLSLNGTNSFFSGEKPTSLEPEDGKDSVRDIKLRLQQGDLHIAGPMWGVNANRHSSDLEHQDIALESDQGVDKYIAPLMDKYSVLAKGLEQEGLKMSYRPLRVYPQDFNYTLGEDELVLTFSLPRGSYATALVRELVNT